MARITGVVLLSLVQAIHAQSSFTVARTAPKNAGTPLPAFISYSIEFCFFPDYAGMLRVQGHIAWLICLHVQETTRVPILFQRICLTILGIFKGLNRTFELGGTLRIMLFTMQVFRML